MYIKLNANLPDEMYVNEKGWITCKPTRSKLIHAKLKLIKEIYSENDEDLNNLFNLYRCDNLKDALKNEPYTALRIKLTEFLKTRGYTLIQYSYTNNHSTYIDFSFHYTIDDKFIYSIKNPYTRFGLYKCEGINIANPNYLKAIEKTKQTIKKRQELAINSDFIESICENRMVLNREKLIDFLNNNIKDLNFNKRGYIQIN